MASTTTKTASHAVERAPSTKTNWATASMGHRSGDDAWMVRWDAHRAHVAAHPDYRTRPAREF